MGNKNTNSAGVSLQLRPFRIFYKETPTSLRMWYLIFTFFLFSTFVISSVSAEEIIIEDILQQTYIRNGTACLPRCGDGSLAMELAEKGFIVLAMDADADSVTALRKKAMYAGILGRKLYVEQGTIDTIPFADNYVDLMILDNLKDEDLTDKLAGEINRVLTPIHGTVLFSGNAGKMEIEQFLKKEVFSGYLLLDTGNLASARKPSLQGSDWWTHKLHGPNNNAVSEDTVFKFPPILQYRAMPMYTPSQGGALTGNGIHYQIEDWRFKRTWMSTVSGMITARSLYTGRIIWQAVAPKEVYSATPTMVLADNDLLVVDGEKNQVCRWNGVTGEELEPLSFGTEETRVRWLSYVDGVLYVLFGNPTKGFPYTFYAGKHVNNEDLNGNEIIALDMDEKKILWKHSEEAPIQYQNLAIDNGKLFFYSDRKRLAALNAGTGELLWQSNGEWLDTLTPKKKLHNFYVARMSSLLAADGVIRLTVAENKNAYLFNTSDGKLLTKIGGSVQKTMIQGGTYVSGTNRFDLTTGNKLDGKVPTSTGTAWCGRTTYAPGAGVIGHSTLGFKSSCAMGAWVSGGILTFGSTICTCGPTPGTAGFASGGEILKRIKESPSHPLIKGEAFNRVQGSGFGVQEGDWGQYRGDYKHRGSSPVAVKKGVKVRWNTSPEKPYKSTDAYNRLSFEFYERPVSPIAVGEYLYTAGSDGVVHSQYVETGETAWTFCADGPVFSSPAFFNGQLFIPCSDGWVYAVEASSGKLAWRRRLAPMDRKILMFDQLMSTWPVLSLAVKDGAVYAAAGHLRTDGGWAFALKAETGEIIWSYYTEPAVNSFAGTHNPPDRAVQGYGGNTALVGDRVWFSGYFTPPLVLDAKTGENTLSEITTQLVGRSAWYSAKRTYHERGVDQTVVGNQAVLFGGRDLLSNTHMRELSSKRLSYKLFFTDQKGDWSLDPRPVQTFTSRLAAACDDELTIMTGVPEIGLTKQETKKKGGHGYGGPTVWNTSRLLETSRARVKGPAHSFNKRKGLSIDKNKLAPSGFLNREDILWKKPGMLINAVVLSSDAVIFAHASEYKSHTGWPWPKSLEQAQETQYFIKGWKLTGCDRKTGEEIWSIDLPSEPMLNGVAIAKDGSVIVVLRDGGIVACGNDGQ